MARRSLPILRDPDSKQVLKDLCKRHRLSLALLTELIEIQRNNLGRGKQIGISQEFNAVIAEFLDNGGGS